MTKHVRTVAAAISDLEGVKAKLEEARDQLQEEIDGKSDRWREGENGEKAQAHLDNIESAVGEIENAIGSLEEITAEE